MHLSLPVAHVCLFPALLLRTRPTYENSIHPPPPHTHTQLSGTVSRLAINTANKYELTPTPIKQKRA